MIEFRRARVEPARSSDSSAEAISRFVEDGGRLFRSIGGDRNVGRVYCYMLLLSEPASLDEIAEAVGISKTAVSQATQELDRGGAIVRLRLRGSRRGLYELVDSPASLLETNREMVRFILVHLERASQLVLTGKGAARVDGYMRTYRRFLDLIDELMTAELEVAGPNSGAAVSTRNAP